MYMAAMSILHNSHDAEDAVHDVFYHIASKNIDTVKKLQFDTDLRYYLLSAAQNTAKNMIKKKQRTNVSLDYLNEYSINKIEDLTDEYFLEIIHDKLDYESIIEVIKSMNKTYRNVLYYHFVSELNIADTARL